MNEFFVRILLTELRKAGFYGAVYEEIPEQITIAPQAGDSFSALHIVLEDGEYVIRYQKEDRAVTNKVLRIRNCVKAIVAAWEQAPPMSVSNFRKLAEWNGVVLAARDDGIRGLHLVTWRYHRGLDSAGNGNYTESIGGALMDFVRRSGLIPKERVLNDERLSAVRAALAYRLEHDEDMYSADMEKITEILSDLEEAVSC